MVWRGVLGYEKEITRVHFVQFFVGNRIAALGTVKQCFSFQSCNYIPQGHGFTTHLGVDNPETTTYNVSKLFMTIE